MFTLCMSRGPPSLQGTQNQNHLPHRQIKGGYLLRYRRNFFCKGWNEEWVVLYDDSTIAWYAEKGLGRPRGYIRISDAPDLLAVGEWTRKIPRVPPFPRGCRRDQLLAVGINRSRHDVLWLMAQSSAEVSDWMTAISNTLPPPPHRPLIDKQLVHPHPPVSAARLSTKPNTPNNGSSTQQNLNNKNNNPANDADYTLVSGIAIEWGHGWGWGQTALNMHTACVHDVAFNSVHYHHTGEDYTIGCEDVDWTAFGDLSFFG